MILSAVGWTMTENGKISITGQIKRVRLDSSWAEPVTGPLFLTAANKAQLRVPASDPDRPFSCLDLD